MICCLWINKTSAIVGRTGERKHPRICCYRKIININVCSLTHAHTHKYLKYKIVLRECLGAELSLTNCAARFWTVRSFPGPRRPPWTWEINKERQRRAAQTCEHDRYDRFLFSLKDKRQASFWPRHLHYSVDSSAVSLPHAPEARLPSYIPNLHDKRSTNKTQQQLNARGFISLQSEKWSTEILGAYGVGVLLVSMKKHRDGQWRVHHE